MARPFAVLAALLALAGSAQGHITFTPNAVVKAPYFTTQLVIAHGTVGQSTQVISIQTPYGVKVTPEQKPGWTLSIAYRNLSVPIVSTHSTLTAVPDVITYSAQVGYALPNEWLFQAFFSVQLLGDEGRGCIYGTPSNPNGGYVAAWYGDVGTSAAPQLGLFFPTSVALIPNNRGAGVGYDPSNVGSPSAQFEAHCTPISQCLTNWTAIPSGAASWGAASTPAPYILLPASAWPSGCYGVMSFAGGNYTTTAGVTTAASGARGARTALSAAALLAAALAALVL